MTDDYDFEGMSGNDYEEYVIELFKSGKATDEQWKEMGAAILDMSEGSDYSRCENIDNYILKKHGNKHK